MGKKLSKNFCANETFHPPRGDVWGGRHSPPQALLSDERMYLKNDVTKKWLFSLIKGVFEMGLLR